MASSSTLSCGICDSQHKITNADYWCPECGEGLCSQCLKHHNASKASRNHGVISVDNFKQLPPSIANISQYCSKHDRNIHDYCPQHESLCCSLCIQSKHATCVGILSLDKVIETANTSALFESLEQNLKDIKRNAERVVNDRKRNLDEIQKQKQKFHTVIKQIRNKINEHIDSLEQQILQNLYETEKKVRSQIEDLLRNLADNIEQVNQLQTNMSAIKKHASDLHAFLGSKMIETEIQTHEQFMKSLFDDGSLQNKDIHCTIEDSVFSILSTVTSFGSISVESYPLVAMEKDLEKDKQTQVKFVHSAPLTNINDIKMTLKREFKYTAVSRYSYAGFTGCTFSSTGDMFLIHNEDKRLLIVNEDGTLKSDIPLSNPNPVDVTCIDDMTVAVSFPGSELIQIINITTKTVERIIKRTGYCHGICYRGGNLLYCRIGRGIQKVNLSEYCSSTLVKDDILSAFSCVAASDDKVFYTNSSNFTVTCCSLTGENLWEYKDQSESDLYGIAVDKDSNVYVASNDNQSIIVLSSDGKQTRKLLGRFEGIFSPQGLAFDLKKEHLLVTDSDSAKLYGLC